MQLKPKKSLGQSFLVDNNIRRKIIEACDFKPTDTVLEIGAGRGELTGLIFPRVCRVFALEIDPVLCTILKSNLKAPPNVTVINEDILDFSLNRYFSKTKGKLKVVGNIPYYITTPIIAHLLRYRGKISTIFITVQKEFAVRMASPSGSKDYGVLSCFIQYYTAPEILFTIKNNSFFPKPKVDSAFLRLELRGKPAVKVKDKRLFFKIIRSAFNQRRKMLKNSLKNIVSAQKLEIFFKKYKVDNSVRPESLTLTQFANLSNV